MAEGKENKKKIGILRAFSIEDNGIIARFFAKAVARHDFYQGVLFDNIYFLFVRIGRSFKRLAETMWRYRNRIIKYFVGALVVFICMISTFNYVTGYEYSYNGRPLGIVKSQEDVTRIVNVASQGLTQEYGVDVQISPEDDFTFRKVVITGKETDDSDKILAKLTYLQNAKATGYGIYVDGKRTVTLASSDEAEGILNDIKSAYSVDERNYDKVYFSEEVEVKEINTTLGKIMNPKVAYRILTTKDDTMEYTVKLGDTVSSIAKSHNMSEDQFAKMNPESEGVLEYGDTVNVASESRDVTVITEETVNYNEKINYEVKKVKDDEIYEGDQEVTQKGKQGSRAVVAKVICANGEQTDKIILSQNVQKEPVTKVVHVGTKERPPDVGTGKLINPCPAGVQTSPFGYRWGRLHRGVDLACGTGNPIYAADNGVVITAGSHYSYGNYIEINHKNGMTTLYAHCSKLLVKKGDIVEKGHLIARVGSTGDSTGPHCHFQVSVNGSVVNPRRYI